MPSAGKLVIDVSAGTAQFLADMDRANAKLKDFGAGAQQSGIHLVSSMQASSAAIRLLENPLGNNIRSVERFIALLPGMSNLLQAAFPIVGAVAFGSILVKIGAEAVSFYQKIEQAPARIAAAFRGLSEPLALSNDELALANDRIIADIARLQGRPQSNGGAIALDEMRVNADRLKESLDKDLGALQELLKKESVGFLQSLVTGSRSTSGDDQGIARFREQLAGAMRSGNDAIRNAKTPEAGRAAEAARNLAIEQLYTAELDRQNALIQQAVRLQADRDSRKDPGAGLRKGATEGGPGGFIPDQTNFIATHKDTVDQLQEELDKVNLITKNAALEGQKTQAEAQHQAAELQKKGAEALLRIQEEVIRAQRAAYAKQQEDARRASDYEAKTLEQRLAKQNAFLESEIEYYNILRKIDEEGWKDQERRGKEQAEEGKKTYEPKPELPEIPVAVSLQQRLAGTPLGQARQIPDNAGLQASHLAELQKELNLSQQTNQPLQDQLKLRQQILETLIAQAAAQGKGDTPDKIKEANVALQQTLNQWRALDIGNVYQDFEAALTKLPESLGNSLASSIFDKPKRGETKGQEVEKGVVHTFEGAGKNVASQILTQGIQRLVAAVVLQTGLQAALNALFPTVQTGQTAAIVGAITASTGAIVTAISAAGAADIFGEGTDFAPGGRAIVGDKGPELVNLPRGAQVVPNNKLAAYMNRGMGSYAAPGLGGSPHAVMIPTVGGGASASPGSGNSYGGNHTFHIYEASSARETARQIANYVKSTGPGFGPFSS